MLAYVLISSMPGHERTVFDNLSSFEEVQDCNMLFGEWDMIAKVSLEGPEDIERFIIDKVRSMDGVELTSTMIVAR